MFFWIFLPSKEIQMLLSNYQKILSYVTFFENTFFLVLHGSSCGHSKVLLIPTFGLPIILISSTSNPNENQSNIFPLAFLTYRHSTPRAPPITLPKVSHDLNPLQHLPMIDPSPSTLSHILLLVFPCLPPLSLNYS